jgi:hypothetical protein
MRLIFIHSVKLEDHPYPGQMNINLINLINPHQQKKQPSSTKKATLINQKTPTHT